MKFPFMRQQVDKESQIKAVAADLSAESFSKEQWFEYTMQLVWLNDKLARRCNKLTKHLNRALDQADVGGQRKTMLKHLGELKFEVERIVSYYKGVTAEEKLLKIGDAMTKFYEAIAQCDEEDEKYDEDDTLPEVEA